MQLEPHIAKLAQQKKRNTAPHLEVLYKDNQN